MKAVFPLTIIALISIASLWFSRDIDPHIEKSTKQVAHYTDNGDGTITDNWSETVWLQHIDCIGRRTWAQAVEITNALSDGMCQLTDESISGNWRIPTKTEYEGLLDRGNFSPVLPPAHPFPGVKDGCYWVISIHPHGGQTMSYLYIGDGGVGLGGMNICANEYHRLKTPAFYLFPIRSRNNSQMSPKMMDR